MEGCILYKEQKFEEALKRFQDTINLVGSNCDLSYNIALCYFKNN